MEKGWSHAGSVLLRVMVTLGMLTALAASAPLPDSIAVKATPKGNAAWLYPATQEQVDNWKAQITTYNLAAGAERAIRVLYVYSTSLDITSATPAIGKLTESAARSFRAIPNVTHIAAIVDADLTAASSNLNKLTSAKLTALADAHARLLCNASSNLDGIQLDLEPYTSVYKTAVLAFTKRLSQDLRDSTICASAAATSRAKFLAFFVGPRQATADLYNALGPNGYAVISGYDLEAPGPGLPETPAQYSANLASNVKAVVDAAAKSAYGKYSIGLPFAASACEFEVGISTKDPANVITGYPMYSATHPNGSYIPVAFLVLNQTLPGGAVNASKLTSPFLGVSVWAWLSRDVVVSGYRHTPKNAFDTPDMAAYLAANMPRKQVMV